MRRTFLVRVCFLIPLIWNSNAISAEPSVMPEVQPPIGVFGSTIHARGDVMLSYRFEREDYDGLMQGTQDLPISEVATEYEVVPTALRVSRHVFEAMWAPVEEFTLVLTVPFYEKQLDWQVGASGPSTTTTVVGFGDVSLTFLYRVFEDERNRVHLNLGIGFPSGSIKESQPVPGSGETIERLPYVMQLGSGTIDLRPGVTYNGYWRGLFWGGQIWGTLQAGTNSSNYTKGNEYELTAWAGRKWARWFGTGFRLAWQQNFNPEGEDLLMLTTDSPLNDAFNQASRRLDALFGVDFYVTGGSLRGLRLSVEAGLPAYLSLDGPQLRNRWSLTAGAQYAF